MTQLFDITIDDLVKLDVQKTLNNIRKSAYAIDWAFKNGCLEAGAFNILGAFGPAITRAERELKIAESFIKREPKQ